MGEVIELLPYLRHTKCDECYAYNECVERLKREDRICSRFVRELTGEVKHAIDNRAEWRKADGWQPLALTEIDLEEATVLEGGVV